jgi:hypothetical protein
MAGLGDCAVSSATGSERSRVISRQRRNGTRIHIGWLFSDSPDGDLEQAETVRSGPAGDVSFGPPSVVVIGRAEATRKNSTTWVLTALHEHFHQYKAANAKYYSEVKQPGLSGGDQTGMV